MRTLYFIDVFASDIAVNYEDCFQVHLNIKMHRGSTFVRSSEEHYA